MTNQERKKRIKNLSDSIYPLNHEKVIASLRYNFLTNPYRQQANNNGQEINDLKQKLEALNSKIYPLFTEMRELQVKYLVEYDGEVIQNGMLTSVPNKKVFYLSTLTDIDSYKETPDYTNEDILTLLNEIKDYIYFQEYSQFSIQHIKRL